MKTRRCAVCGKIKSITEFGKGVRVPKTTCLACKDRAAEPETKIIMQVKRIVKSGKVEK